MINPKIPHISLPLEDYVFMLICRSKFNYGVIDQEQANRVMACPRYRDYCHIESAGDTYRDTGLPLFRLWRLDHWTAELERRSADKRLSDERRVKACEQDERRKAAIVRLMTIMPAFDEKTAQQVVQWCIEDQPGMEKTKTILGL